MPDSEVDFSDIPLQDPNDPKWKNAVVGRFYRPIKKPIALRLDADLIAWLKAKGPGYQSRINEILRERMAAERKRA
ncbi:MAG TPA: BrnA antitoxin family protein [Bryobacteraceae bacterium]